MALACHRNVRQSWGTIWGTRERGGHWRLGVMRRGTNRLRPLQIERFKGPGKLSDGGGLYLIIGRNGSRTWVFRYTRRSKAVELGLGAVASVPVTEARAAAA